MCFAPACTVDKEMKTFAEYLGSERMFESVGVLRYSNQPLLKLVLEVDRGIYHFYRSMVPKAVGLQGQRYAPHISVVRKEVPPLMEFWGKHEGEQVPFKYSNVVHNGQVYYWLNAYSTRLEEIRKELGLPLSSKYTQPPGGFEKCFHITIGNVKGSLVEYAA
jgi:hypothetical protein